MNNNDHEPFLVHELFMNFVHKLFMNIEVHEHLNVHELSCSWIVPVDSTGIITGKSTNWLTNIKIMCDI